MGSVLSYSGISTKIRAMSSHLVTDEQLQEIVRFSDVPQVAAYLKKTPEYAKAWSDLDENNLHRGEIEKLLKKSIFGNFSRIYNFANKEQRKFLALYSKRYEIRVLKEIMTNLFDHRSTDPVDMSPYRDFFLHHSKLDIDRVAGAGNMDEFMTALKGNEFYAPLQSVYENGNGLLFDYGMALDLYYFNQIWSVRKKLFKGNDLDEGFELFTDRMHVTYTGGPFTQNSLNLNAVGGQNAYGAVWYYGEKGDNLGGTARTLDGVDGECQLQEGIMSRSGCSQIDDSHSLVLDENGWTQVRTGDGVDIYVFAYGNDYKEALNDFYRLTGKTNTA